MSISFLLRQTECLFAIRRKQERGSFQFLGNVEADMSARSAPQTYIRRIRTVQGPRVACYGALLDAPMPGKYFGCTLM